MRRFAILLVLVAAARGGEKTDLEQPPVSAKARQLREQAQALWDGAQPVWEKIRAKKEVTPDEAAATIATVEQAVDLFERSVREEWHDDANRALADAAKAWCKLRPLVPPAEPPADEAAQKKAAKAAEAARAERVRDLRAFVMEYGAERRPERFFRMCPRCDGRGQVASPFGDKIDCAVCGKKGKLLNRDGIIAARWIRYSPLHRAAGRNESELNRLLRGTPPDAQRDLFAPYNRTLEIKEVEDNDFWARVKTKELVQPLALSKKTEKADGVYLLFRVGKVWYLYDKESDRDLIDLTAQLEAAAPAAAH